jgi:superfamily II DNA/RNA helicase
MAQAQAGTGKTLCFLTTILQMAITQVHAEEFQKQLKIKANNDPNIIQSIQNVSPFSIVIVPTRELALQIVDQITRFA